MKQPEKLLSADEVKATLAPHMKAVWDAAAKCLDTPTDENLSEFKKLCRPGEIIVLLRHYAESVVSETNVRGHAAPGQALKNLSEGFLGVACAGLFCFLFFSIGSSQQTVRISESK